MNILDWVEQKLYSRKASLLWLRHQAERRDRDLETQMVIDRERKLARGEALEYAFTLLFNDRFKQNSKAALDEICKVCSQDAYNLAWTIIETRMQDTPLNARVGKAKGAGKLALIGAKEVSWVSEEAIQLNFGGRQIIVAIPAPSAP